MMNMMSRRTFMGAAGMVAASLAGANIALADDAVKVDGEAVAENSEMTPNRGIGLPWSGPGSAKGDWNGTPEEIKAVGGCTMPLDELNRRRKMYVDSFTEDYVCSDGRVIPNIYVKVTRLMGTYCYGVGNDATDICYNLSMQMTEDEAQAYLDMPMGQQFTAYDFSVESGRSVEECEYYCRALADKAWLNRTYNDNGELYCQIPHLQGVLEYHDPDWYAGRVSLEDCLGAFMSDMIDTAYNRAGSPFLHTVPVYPEAVKDGAIYPYDDVRAIWATKKKFSLSPCCCRMIYSYYSGQDLGPDFPDGDYDIRGVKADPCGHTLETCLSCGEEAQFWIEHHVGREITYEEAMEILDQSVEEGFILQCTPSKNAETICSCHGDCCGCLGNWKALGGPEAIAASTTHKQATHYVVECDYDSCLKCGTCMNRCPMEAISMDEETGLPQVNGACFACGQCVHVCPAKARILVPKPAEEVLAPWEDMIDLNNMMAAQRFEAGLVW